MKRSKFTQSFVIALVFALPGIATGQALTGVVPSSNPEQTMPTPVDDPSPNDLRELMRLLADERVQHWLNVQAIADIEDAESDEDDGVKLQEWLAARLGAVNLRVQRLQAAWANVGKQLDDFRTGWAQQLGEGETLRSIVYVIVFLIIGAGRGYRPPAHSASAGNARLREYVPGRSRSGRCRRTY